MKVNLVVTAAGPNHGKAVPIPGATFLIGRDPHCNLRPASQAVSKQHCAIHIRNGQVFVQDFGSTNGTLVNEVAVEGERAVQDGDMIKIGPLEFRVQIVQSPAPADGTPLPNKLKPLSNSAVTSAAPKPKAPSTPAQKPVAPAPNPAPPPVKKPEPIRSQSADADAAAAMLLSMDDDHPSGEQPSIPEGSTVMEIPTIDASGRMIPPQPKPPQKVEAESSSAASELLKKYFRRSS
jgi:pSer/pThr/pTyr-binding forkhead associated (FHA) protein